MQSVKAEGSLVSMDFSLCSWGRTKAGSQAESTAVDEARVVGVKVRVECADTLQRPEEEKKKTCQEAASERLQISTFGEKNALYKRKCE